MLIEKKKKILKTIGAIIATIFFGITAIFLFDKHKDKKEEIEKAEKAKEEKKDELEKKTADDIAADSPNPDTISANIEREQEELRQPLRDRFNKNIQRNGSSSDN